jgi:hypothetical protein
MYIPSENNTQRKSLLCVLAISLGFVKIFSKLITAKITCIDDLIRINTLFSAFSQKKPASQSVVRPVFDDVIFSSFRSFVRSLVCTFVRYYTCKYFYVFMNGNSKNALNPLCHAQKFLHFYSIFSTIFSLEKKYQLGYFATHHSSNDNFRHETTERKI